MYPASENHESRVRPAPTGGRIRFQLPCLMRKHLPTGSVTQAEWTGHQHWMLSDPQSHPPRALQRVCDELVAKWNQQQPDTWQYWLE